MDDGVSEMLKMRNRRWLFPFWEKQIGGGRGRCMARKCVESLLGDEVRNLDIDGFALVLWDGCKWDYNAVLVVICKGRRIERIFV